MPDMEKLQNNKEKILSVIQKIGPSYPGKIAKETGLSPLFASAFLSELVSDRKLKISDMRVGSSPLYYSEGQESQLEKFTEYLNHKEKEAFFLLKQSGILEDEKQEPSIRVALRKIKDFAHPINVRVDNETKTFWKHFLIPNEEAHSKIESFISPNKKSEKSTLLQKTEEKIDKKEKQNEEMEGKKTEEKTEQKETQKKKVKSKPQQPSQFANNIREYLTAKDIEILSEMSEKKKEFVSKVRHDTSLGKQEYYLIAKDKKKISMNDLTIALQQAQSNKMPALVLSPGELDKKASEYLQEWKNLVKFEKVKV